MKQSIYFQKCHILDYLLPSSDITQLFRDYLPGLLAIMFMLTNGCAYIEKNKLDPLSEPFADIHLHFNWDQRELLSAKEAASRLKKNNVVFAVVSSVPTQYALEMANAGKGWIIPLFSPYISVEHRRTWFRDPMVVKKAREGLNKGLYKGIGELHLWDGMKPKRDNDVFLQLLALAVEFDVPLLIHTESANYRYFAQICQQHSQVRFLWAHAGGTLDARSVAKLMAICPNVWIDLSVRDPWRYDTLVTKNQQLLPGWRSLIMRYPDRVLIGSDPVWNVTRTQAWDEADAGWDHISQLINFHRRWLKQLPADIESKIRLTNAIQFFRAKEYSPENFPNRNLNNN